MFFKIIKNRIIQTILGITIILLTIIAIQLPKESEKNTIDMVVANSINAVEQIKLTRAYYVKEVVGDIKKYAPNIKFDYNHGGVDGKLAFPTSLIHELSEEFTKNTGQQFRLYSKYPFKPKSNRKLDNSQKEALSFINKEGNHLWVKRDKVEGKNVLRVAIPDYMNQKGCVKCHNSHTDKTWDFDWKLGDKRGIIEVVTPIEDFLSSTNETKNNMLLLITLGMIVIITIYSYSLVRRETQLLDMNDELDRRVKEELSKNIEKEKQLIQQSRSAAMGDMMAAIIHQWKQPLNGILVATSAIEAEKELGILDDESIDTNLAAAKDQIDIMNQTMEDFRNFFKPQNLACYDVKRSIDTTIKMIEGIYIKDSIKIITKYTKDDVLVSGYPNEFSQVIVNVLNNARDAIVENNCQVKKIYINLTSKEGKAIIEISDCAGGIPEDIIEKIFEPYFSTKGDEKGTGIGLDMSKTIVEKVAGELSVVNDELEFEDKKCKGAKFTIKLNLANTTLEDNFE